MMISYVNQTGLIKLAAAAAAKICSYHYRTSSSGGGRKKIKVWRKPNN
jgi:hypothetical protein